MSRATASAGTVQQPVDKISRHSSGTDCWRLRRTHTRLEDQEKVS